MTGDTHYDLEILAELAEGLLDAATAEQVREHLAVCDPCGELLADLAAVREVLAATPTPAMPMGVAMRIDQALAREAAGGGLDLLDGPDWEELTRQTPEPVRLGTAADDGDLVPAYSSGRAASGHGYSGHGASGHSGLGRRPGARRPAGQRPPAQRSPGRRRWGMPLVAAAAAAVVVGAAGLSTGLLAGGSDPSPGRSLQALPQPSVSKPALSYMVTDTDYNWSSQDLKQPLSTFLGAAPGSKDAGGVDPKVSACVERVAARSKLRPFTVDQSEFNGQEALIIASWKDKTALRVRVDVVDPFKCKNIVKPTLGNWK
ncbi:anti-sigma factor family protein [Nonomuraea dietziae]|uniref:anti-sigma factor family protein n=1 Tax=Nonomuraea dietziae TaxID=65515 RepID=UPI0033F5731B